MKNICVSVGVGIGGQKEIMSAIQKEGFKVDCSYEQWPRDTWVYFNDKYVLRGDIGVEGNVFGDGGNVLQGEDFLLVSDNAFMFQNIRNKVKDKFGEINSKNYELAKEIISEDGEKIFGAKVHVTPTGYYHGKTGQLHNDMVSLLLPKSKILLFDNFYGGNGNKFGHYNEIAKKENLEFINYDGGQDGVWYPLNSCVLPWPKNEAVVVDSKASSLIKILKDMEIKIIPVDMPQHTYPAGKINCQTNIYNLRDKNFIDSLDDVLD
jgi:hypothetical protein